jgi:hypothetical protein
MSGQPVSSVLHRHNYKNDATYSRIAAAFLYLIHEGNNERWTVS